MGPGNVDIFGGTITVNTLNFGAGAYTLQDTGAPAGSLSLSTLGHSAGTNEISLLLNSGALAANVTGGQLNVTNTGNTIAGGAWTVSGGATLYVEASGTGSGLGAADVTLSGGTLDLAGAVVTSTGLLGRYYNADADNTGLYARGGTFGNGLVEFDTYAGITNLIDNRLGSPDSAQQLTVDLDFPAGGGDDSTGGNPFSTIGVDVGSDDIMAFWSGQLTVSAGDAGVTTFRTTSDDGTVIYIDGVKVVDNNNFQGVTSRSGTYNLTPGEHNILVGFYEGGGTSQITRTGDYEAAPGRNTTNDFGVRLESAGSLATGQTLDVTNTIISIGNSGAVAAGAVLNVNENATLRFYDDGDGRRPSTGTYNLNAGGMVAINSYNRMINGATFNFDPDSYVFLRDNLNDNDRTVNQADPNASPGTDGLWNTYDAGEKLGFDGINIIIAADQFGLNATGGGGLYLGAGRRLTVAWNQGHNTHTTNTAIRKSASADPTGSYVIFSSSGGGYNSNGAGGDLNIDSEILLPGVDLYVNDAIGSPTHYIDLPSDENNYTRRLVANDGRVNFDGAVIQGRDVVVRNGYLRFGSNERDVDTTMTGKAEIYDNAEMEICAARADTDPAGIRYQLEAGTLFPGGIHLDKGGYLYLFYATDEAASGAGDYRWTVTPKDIPQAITFRGTGDVPGEGRDMSIFRANEEGGDGNNDNHVLFSNLTFEDGAHVGIGRNEVDREELRLGITLTGNATIEREGDEFSLQDVSAVGGPHTLTIGRVGEGGTTDVYGTVGPGAVLNVADTSLNFLPNSGLAAGGAARNAGEVAGPGYGGIIRVYVPDPAVRTGGSGSNAPVIDGMIELGDGEDAEIRIDEVPSGPSLTYTMGGGVRFLADADPGSIDGYFSVGQWQGSSVAGAGLIAKHFSVLLPQLRDGHPLQRGDLFAYVHVHAVLLSRFSRTVNQHGH